MKWLSVLAVAGLCAACSSGTPAANAAAGSNPATETNAPTTSTVATGPNAPAGTGDPAGTSASTAPAVEKATFREITLPAGTALSLKMTSAVASDTSRVEEPVHAELREAVRINHETVLPAGAEVNGVVTDVARSGRVKGRARVAYRFTSVRTHGETYEIKTGTITREARATKGKDARNVAIGAGVGAALGAVLGGGGGAAKGAAVGGAGGVGYDLATRGEEVHIAPGAPVTVRLTAPLTVRIKI